MALFAAVGALVFAAIIVFGVRAIVERFSNPPKNKRTKH